MAATPHSSGDAAVTTAQSSVIVQRRSFWPKDRRFVLISIVAIALAANFLSSSRMPALNEKALMAGDTQLESLGFETVLPVQADDPLLVRTTKSTINWLETNRKGMTFGVLFGACLLLVIGLLQRKSVQSGLGNSAIGMIIGAPWSVCVNCAAPIAQGLHSAGARAEMMLSAMISSPTLNVIVLAMLIALFPPYMVVIKLALTVAFILIGVPLLVRLLLRQGQLAPAGDGGGSLPTNPDPFNVAGEGSGATWWEASTWLVRAFPRSLWFIVKKTVPLMFLAGFLGALFITLVPWENLPTVVRPSGLVTTLVSMGVVAVIGLALPVPITFDIIVSAVLLAAGMPIKYVMVLLFVLGPFSIYAFLIVWNAMPKRVALGVSGALLMLAMVAGVSAHLYAEWDEGRQRQLFVAELSQNLDSDGPTVLWVGGDAAADAAALVPSLRASAVTGVALAASGLPDGVSVERFGFQPRSGVSSGPLFERLEGHHLGLQPSQGFSVLSWIELTRYRSLATGDVHNDGWSDILLTSHGGLWLYANQGGTAFVAQQIEVPGLNEFFIANAATVDLDNDGWLDLFFATYGQGNYVIYNREGRFSEAELHQLPNWDDAVLSAAVAFGDVDRNGHLDIVLGNWSIGFVGNTTGWSIASSRNALLLNDGSREFQMQPLPGHDGETLSTLLSDINGDGYLDLIIGNDFEAPDNYYLGDGNGGFSLIMRADSVVPHTTFSTMSVATADIDNDLRHEIYLGQISGRAGDTNLEMHRLGPQICAEIVDAGHREYCERAMTVQRDIADARRRQNASKCLAIDPDYREDCIAVALLLSTAGKERELCSYFPSGWEIFDFPCRQSFDSDHIVLTQKELAPTIPQRKNTDNVLLVPSGDGKFVDRATLMGLNTGGWTWNAKFADVDNDEWQDLFVANGQLMFSTLEPNLFYHNQGGTTFVEQAREFGLRSLLPSSSYSYVDIGNSGDLDIVVNPDVGPVLVYLNNSSPGNSIAFELRDLVGNRFGIGSKIIIHYGPGGSRHQVREIQASGGFVSYDAPIAHFGLGEFDRVARVEVEWSTGERDEIEEEFLAGARYRITRSR